MDPRLSQAARLGDLATFKSLLEEDPLLLEKVALSPSSDTPLHIATLAAKTDFAREIILRMPNFARELNHDGFSPLHIAAAVGNIEITRLLLSLDSGLCLVKDKQGRTPLHWAAMKGRVEIVGELISHCYEAVKEVSSSGETALDLAVKNNQFEVLEVLVEKLGEDDHDLLINAPDDQGNTIYQLTTSSGGQDRVQVQNLFKNQSIPEESRTGIANGESKKDGNKLKEQLGPVVASLIATMTYQAGLNPPQSIWRPGMKLHCSFRETLKISMLHPTEPCPAVSFYLFLLLNAIGFFSAVLYLCLGKEDKYLWQFSLACMTLTYICLSDTMMFNATTAIVLAAAVILVLVLWVAEDFLVHTAPNLKQKWKTNRLFQVPNHDSETD